jgi:hypothetical protein
MPLFYFGNHVNVPTTQSSNKKKAAQDDSVDFARANIETL